MNNQDTPLMIIGEVIDVAEHSTYLELTSRVCYYDEPNLNNDMLPYDDNASTIAQTLVNMPVQAKYRVSPTGEDTFGSHEMHRKKDGQIVFDTVSIGTHVETWIENDNVTITDGTIKELPCLFAKYRLWKRYPKMIAAAKRLFSEGKLYSSWELNTYQYIYDRGIRKLTDYEFLSNCLLGYEYSYPSYGTSANAISMAQFNDNQLMIAEALSQDLLDENIDNNDKEDNLLVNNNEASVEEKIVSPGEETIAEDTAKNEKVVEEANENIISSEAEEKTKENTIVDSAQLTTWDLRTKVNEACRAKLDKWCWIFYMFPNEKEVWCEYEGRGSELDYVRFTYEVDSEDNITVSEPEYVKLTVSVADINSKFAELESKVEKAESELNVKNEAIINANETIQNLKVKISELEPYKEQVETAERERIEQEIVAEKEALKNKLLKGNLFTETEIAEQHIQDLIEARDVSAINSLIADKFVASFDVKDISEEKAVVAEEVVATASANLESEDVETDIRSFMGRILFN